MPAKTEKEARFMRAVEHGWKPDRVKAPPMDVAEEFDHTAKGYADGGVVQASPRYQPVNRGMPQRMQIDPVVLNGKPPDEPLPNLGVEPMPAPLKPDVKPADAATALQEPPPSTNQPMSSISAMNDPGFREFVRQRAVSLGAAQKDANERQRWADMANGFERARAWGNNVAPDQGAIEHNNSQAQLPVTQLNQRTAAESGAIKDLEAGQQVEERGLKVQGTRDSYDPNSALSKNARMLAVAQKMIPASYSGPYTASMHQEMLKGAELEVARQHWEAMTGIAKAHLGIEQGRLDEEKRYHDMTGNLKLHPPLQPQQVTELESLISGVKALDDLKGARDTSGVVDKALSLVGMGDYAATKTAAAGEIAKADSKGRVNPTGTAREMKLLPGAMTPGGDTQLKDRRRHMLDAAEQRIGMLEAGGARPAEIAVYRQQLEDLKQGQGNVGRPAGGKDVPVQIRDDAQYKSLPSGAEFIGPDGKHRRKP